MRSQLNRGRRLISAFVPALAWWRASRARMFNSWRHRRELNTHGAHSSTRGRSVADPDAGTARRDPIPYALETLWLAGAYRIRTAESGREPLNWICVTISSEVGASPAAETSHELRDTDLQLVKISAHDL